MRVIKNCNCVMSLLLAASFAGATGCRAPASRNIHFETEKFEPRASDDFVAVGRAVEVMIKHPKLRLVVVGYTDAVGSDEYNRDLASRRATRVRELVLIAEPTLEARTAIAYYGMARPIADNSTAEGKAKNRRVELFFYYPKIGVADEDTLQRHFGSGLEFKASASASVE